MNKFYLVLLCLLFSGALSAQSIIRTDEPAKDDIKVKNKSSNTVVVQSQNTQVTQTDVTTTKASGSTVKQATNNGKTDVQSTTQTKLSKTDFDNLPETRKTYVLEHPELFKIEE